MRLMIGSIIIFFVAATFAQAGAAQWTIEPWIKDDPKEDDASFTNRSLPQLVGFNISGQEPWAVFPGKERISYEDYKSCNRSSELWISNGSNWSWHHSAKQGDNLALIAYTPSGGQADLYLIDYSRNCTFHRECLLLPGYYNATFPAEGIGRIMLVLAADGQPSNAVVIDVRPKSELFSNPKIERPPPALAKVTIASESIKGYDVHLDDVYYRSDMGDGSMDGLVSFTVKGDIIHKIVISKRGSFGVLAYRSEYIKSFESGNSYKLTI